MFSKILIANRGEIAVRIIQACRELDIATVAVYSEADAGALHVRLADEAMPVGPAPATESYLHVPALLEAARVSGAEAIHPGYGFLAENAAFARDVEGAGLVWIGPPASVIALMGDKIVAKELARSVGVPVVPGYFGDDQSAERMLAEAESIGFPVMVKAAAGGGGRGMREVHAPEDFLDALESARREAVSTSNSDLMFLERLLRAPRHLEVQILADHHGAVVALGERDCSVQRRHQKVLEEAPSPILNADLRRSMSQDAVRLAQASGYTNAGTIEFLFSDDSYYFLEMNTRIQVEHPVTEEITGIDLVRRQIEIAAGYRLNMRQADVQLTGHAIEVRVYAEDSGRQFLPTTGTIRVFSPPQGPGIRNDVGVSIGADVTPYYDAMLAKLIVRAASRSAAIARLRDALDRYRVEGVVTNLPFLSWLVRQTDFVHGRVSTDFLDATWMKRETGPPPVAALVAAACFEMVRPHAGDEVAQPDGGFHLWSRGTAWRGFGLSRSFAFDHAGERAHVEVTREVDHFVVSTDHSETMEVRFDSRSDPRNLVVANGEAIPFDVVRAGDGVDVALHGDVYHFSIPPEDAYARAGQDRGHDAGRLTSPMPGTVVKVPVRKGDPVSQGQTLVVVEAMKMEHIIQAPFSGVVHDVYFAPGDMVGAGAPVVHLERD